MSAKALPPLFVLMALAGCASDPLGLGSPQLTPINNPANTVGEKVSMPLPAPQAEAAGRSEISSPL